MVYTFSFSKVLRAAFYYQEMAGAKDKTTQTIETTTATEVQEVAQVREVVKLTNVKVTDCMANFAGSLGSRGRCQQNKKRNEK